MRKSFLSLAVAGTLVVVTVSATQAQIFPPVFPGPVVPPAVAPIPTRSAPTPVAITSERTSLDLEMGLGAPRTDERRAVATLRELLVGRGIGPEVVDGPMLARAPGTAAPSDFGRDGELDAPLGSGGQAAWLSDAEGGRWWLWEYGAAAPADQHAEVYEAHMRRQAQAEGRFLGD